ncbi:hypothetical protein NQZ68_021793 [Dissostichus eleginoides]|nr:hypothetical protein NQZ68_021793 [Dissostichus eleginoides]
MTHLFLPVCGFSLGKRAELMEQMEILREQLRVQRGRRGGKCEAAHLWNSNLLQDLQQVEDRLRGAQLPRPDLLAMKLWLLLLLKEGAAAEGGCCCWRVLLLEEGAAAGGCCCWRTVLLLKEGAAAGGCCCWRRVLLLEEGAAAGGGCCCWRRVLLLEEGAAAEGGWCWQRLQVMTAERRGGWRLLTVDREWRCQMRYWASVEGSLPAWEHFLLGKGLLPAPGPGHLPRRAKQRASTATDQGLSPPPQTQDCSPALLTRSGGLTNAVIRTLVVEVVGGWQLPGSSAGPSAAGPQGPTSQRPPLPGLVGLCGVLV